MPSADRSALRIAELKQRQPTRSRLMTVKIPERQWSVIAGLADQIGTSKTEVMVALLNAGLDKWRQRGRSK